MPNNTEEQMLQAIKDKRNFKRDNTRVEAIEFDGIETRIHVYLFSSKIFTLTDQNFTINHCGWRTNVTKSRLNALLDYYHAGAGIHRSHGAWYLRLPSKVEGVQWSWTELETLSTDYTFPRLDNQNDEHTRELHRSNHVHARLDYESREIEY